MTRLSPHQESLPGAGLVEDLFWAAAHPRDRLEHVAVTAGDTWLNAVVFVRAVGPDEAETQVRGLCARVLQRMLPLAGWVVTRISAEFP
jgi:hypothetical protein